MRHLYAFPLFLKQVLINDDLSDGGASTYADGDSPVDDGGDEMGDYVDPDIEHWTDSAMQEEMQESEVPRLSFRTLEDTILNYVISSWEKIEKRFLSGTILATSPSGCRTSRNVFCSCH